MYKSFEEMNVRQLGREGYKLLGSIFYAPTFRNYSFQDQIMRAANSVTNNIAEGYERLSRKEFIRFLSISKGSAGEIRSMLYNAYDMKYINEKQMHEFIAYYRNISVKLYNLIESIKKQL